MKYFSSLLLLAIILVVSIATPVRCDASDQERQAYIVYMGALPEGESLLSSHHANMLQNVVNSSSTRKSLIRSYTRSFNAFAAYLTEQEKEKLAHMDEVVSVFPSRTLKLQTTRSWDFMGFNTNIKRHPKIESNVIIGVIDSGIWPESESFSDESFGPIPNKWKGVCKGGKNFTCNKKIVGARWYSTSEVTSNISVRDTEGHGTHTSSTAAGNIVNGPSFYGIAKGTARGGVPSARIAAYKVCYEGLGCKEADILAAFDDAIADGVDLITISMGSEQASELTSDAIAIGSFHAMEKGILTVNSAGNSYSIGSTGSVAPWMLSVAASNTDRQIINKLVLGNGKLISGNAVNSYDFKGKKYPIISGMNASSALYCDGSAAMACQEGCLDSKLVKGKIVVCNDPSGAKEAKRSLAVGVVVTGDNTYDTSFITPMPSAVLLSKDLKPVYAYMNSTRNQGYKGTTLEQIMFKTPQATISKSESVLNRDAPIIATFSSKGPNFIIPEILKPDLAAPGVDILAAFSPMASPSGMATDKRSVKYSLLSGTSMACPHVAAAAAYVKTFHPHWSPSTIKSALMTTAWQMNATNNPGAEFAYGAGHIDPKKAIKPGLVYKTERDDYIKMLCEIYDISTINRVFRGNNSCETGLKDKLSPKDMNYPSMVYKVANNDTPSFSVSFARNVTNVGRANSKYKATVTGNPKLNITIVPSVLFFDSVGQKLSFEVHVKGNISYESSLSILAVESASLVWSDGIHAVRSPIVIYLYKY